MRNLFFNKRFYQLIIFPACQMSENVLKEFLLKINARE